VATAAGGARGGFAEAIVVRADHAVAIPDGLADEHAAPLLCGGITVFSPLVDNDCVGKRVGVAGLGGLGAMGVQLAAARGNVVTAVSATPDKAALARELGAAQFVNIRDEAAVKAAGDSLDVLIVTFNVAPPSWDPYLSLLDKHGVLVLVGAVPGPSPFPVVGRFFFHQLSIRASITGGLGRIAELLRFAADHGIKPHVEVFPFDDINNALQKVVDNKVRFRAVLKW
jgi:alcohol/geraniol dehydrogenase (NADP+)